MPTLFLKTRDLRLTELMDDPACDLDKLERTYRHFQILNPLIAGWGRVYRRWIRPRLRQGPATLLDVGCGGGDVAAYLLERARRERLELTVTGIDPDERAIAWGRTRVDFELLACHSSELVDAGRTFDFVISNHVVHHLKPDELQGLLRDSQALATSAAIHNDIARDDVGFAVFWMLAGVFFGSFIRTDGLRSIRRSYTKEELRTVLPGDWRAAGMVPFRLLSVLER